tara:strand:+ start:178 stop:648 length:471 start_codon:yes stop_codon:yes gene_type:complete
MNLFEWKSYEIKLLNPGQCEFDRVFRYLRRVDGGFPIKLSLRIDLQEYAEKLASKAFNLFVNLDGDDIAHAAFYYDEKSSYIFITSIAVIDEYTGRGLGKKLLNEIEKFALSESIGLLELEADCNSKSLLDFYTKNAFELNHRKNSCLLRKYLKNE